MSHRRVRKTSPRKRIDPSSVALGKRGIRTAEDFTRVFSALITDALTGDVSVAKVSAACRAGGNLLKAVELAHRFGR